MLQVHAADGSIYLSVTKQIKDEKEFAKNLKCWYGIGIRRIN